MSAARKRRDAGQLQTVARAVLTPFFRFCWRIRTEGLDRIPDTGGALIAPNHTSVLDSFFVPLVLPRRITYVGKAEYLDDWKTKYLFPAMGMIPIDRGGGDASKRALDASATVLERGELFGIYPEGTRSRSGQLHKGHTGVARLALRTGSPIVPVGIVGADAIQPADAKVPRFFRELTIRFGEPIDVTRYLDRANDRLVLRQITDEVMYEIRNLSGQDYVDTYATKRHESIPTGRTTVGLRPESDRRVTTEPATPEPVEAVDEFEPSAARSSSEVIQQRPLVDLLRI
ncbi:MAG TPA: lysophospholipid acyltransferase family protein [Microthrixaceae bacterium]|nr:lysophospholipid acyltransferase family protein [Microthrixaceae bacterium]